MVPQYNGGVTWPGGAADPEAVRPVKGSPVRRLRALDKRTGQTLWEGRMPANRRKHDQNADD